MSVSACSLDLCYEKPKFTDGLRKITNFPEHLRRSRSPRFSSRLTPRRPGPTHQNHQEHVGQKNGANKSMDYEQLVTAIDAASQTLLGRAAKAVNKEENQLRSV